jgi:hypothetical protein
MTKTVKVVSAHGSYIIRLYRSVTHKWQYTISLGVVSRLYDTENEALTAALERLLK